MDTFRSFLLLCVVGFTLTTTLVTTKAVARDNVELNGSWQITAQGGTITLVFSSDHTYIMTTHGLPRQIAHSTTGYWKRDGSRLVLTIKTSTDKKVIGTQEVFEIIKVDDAILILKEDGKELMATFNRVKPR